MYSSGFGYDVVEMGAPIYGGPMYGAPIVGAPIYGAPIIGGPMIGAPVMRAPIIGAPIMGAPIIGAPIIGGPVYGAGFGVPVTETIVTSDYIGGPMGFYWLWSIFAFVWLLLVALIRTYSLT